MGIEEIRKLKGEAGLPKPKKTYSIPKKSAKKKEKEIKEKAERGGEPTDLQKWYTEIMNREDKICWNCGINLSHYNKQDWHACVAHVLPKSLFPSIATHPSNFMILGKWCNCHGVYDSNWGSASRMKIFKEAVDRFTELEPFILEKHRIPEVFKKINNP